MTKISLQEFQKINSLSDSSLASFVLDYGTCCEIDKAHGILINTENINLEEILEKIRYDAKNKWFDNKDVLVAMISRIINKELQKILLETLESHE